MKDHESNESADLPVLDVAHLRDVCGDDLAFEREIIGDFLDHVAPLHLNLVEAVASGNAAAIRFAAHSLKGTCRSLGAVALAAPCAELEEMGEREDLSGATDALKRAAAELDRLRERIQLHLDDLAA